MVLVPPRAAALPLLLPFASDTAAFQQQDQRAPILSDAQWSSLALALSIEEIQAMVIVGDTPFVTDSIHDARAKARCPSSVSHESGKRFRTYKSGWVPAETALYRAFLSP